jgi:hypothetical protein
VDGGIKRLEAEWAASDDSTTSSHSDSDSDDDQGEEEEEGRLRTVEAWNSRYMGARDTNQCQFQGTSGDLSVATFRMNESKTNPSNDVFTGHFSKETEFGRGWGRTRERRRRKWMVYKRQ